MGIDVNDLKILINTGFRYLIKTIHQWAKDHPFVTGVLLFFYLLYIFFPNLFDLLFYIFPLIICIAIILSAKHISSKQIEEQAKNNRKYDILRTMSIDHRRRPQLTSHMRSKTTLGNFDRMSFDRSENFLSNVVSSRDEMCRTNNENSNLNLNLNSRSSSCIQSEKTSPTQTSQQTSAGISSHSESDEENEDELSRESRKPVVEWTEDDQRNLMDLGSSEIERNKRLESLIAKRRAKKQLSMQPIRRPHYPYENLMDQGGSIMVSRCVEVDTEHQPGSAPCFLRRRRNPFNLPYDAHEEKPVLTGGSFDDEIFSNEQKELIVGEQRECLRNKNENANENESFGGDVEDPVIKSLPSFFTKPKMLEKPGFTRFRRESEENLREIIDGISKEDAVNEHKPNQQDSSGKVQVSTGLKVPNKEHNELENPFAKHDDSSDTKNKDETEADNDKEENIFNNRSKPPLKQVKNQPSIQDNVSINKGADDDDDTTSSSSSSSSEMTINAIKNEAFRNSVRKVLNCLVIQRYKANQTATSNDILANSIFDTTSPTKMEERSFYTHRPHHSSTFSIASDMQVEVSETGSPPLATLDPTSPPEPDLVYDGDVDKDANSGDEDLWGASPHPNKLGEFETNTKLKLLPDITEEENDVKGLDIGGVCSEIDPNDEERLGEGIDKGKEVDRDHRSIDAAIVGSGSSVSSSSDGSMSQLQAKSEHLAEFLANLAPAESILLEEPETTLHFRDPSAEENTIFALGEAKDESRESEKMKGSHQGNNDQSTIASETRLAMMEKHSTPIEPNEAEATHQELYIGDVDNQRTIVEEEPSLVDSDVRETECYSSETIGGHEKELISDSFSTTCQEEILEQSRLEEELEQTIISEEITNVQKDKAEVIESSIDDSIIHDRSTLIEKVEDNQVPIQATFLDEKKSEHDEQSIESEMKSTKAVEDTQSIDEKQLIHDNLSGDSEVKLQEATEDVQANNDILSSIESEAKLQKAAEDAQANNDILFIEKQSKHENEKVEDNKPGMEIEVKLREAAQDAQANNDTLLNEKRSEVNEEINEGGVKLEKAVEEKAQANHPSSINEKKLDVDDSSRDSEVKLPETTEVAQANHAMLSDEKRSEVDEEINEGGVKSEKAVEEKAQANHPSSIDEKKLDADDSSRDSEVKLPETTEVAQANHAMLSDEKQSKQGNEVKLREGNEVGKVKHDKLLEEKAEDNKPSTESEVKLREANEDGKVKHETLSEEKAEDSKPSMENTVKLQEAANHEDVQANETTLLNNDKKSHDESSVDGKLKLPETIEDAQANNDKLSLNEKKTEIDQPNIKNEIKLELEESAQHDITLLSEKKSLEHDEPRIESEEKLRQAMGDGQANHGTLLDGMNLKHDEPTSTDSEVKLQETVEDAPQAAMIEEDNMAPSSSTEAVSSRPIDEVQEDKSDHPNT